MTELRISTFDRIITEARSDEEYQRMLNKRLLQAGFNLERPITINRDYVEMQFIYTQEESGT